MWECGNVGMWECGNVGMWECGNVGMWECGSVGVCAVVLEQIIKKGQRPFFKSSQPFTFSLP
jgi:hypothetical protein